MTRLHTIQGGTIGNIYRHYRDIIFAPGRPYRPNDSISELLGFAGGFVNAQHLPRRDGGILARLTHILEKVQRLGHGGLHVQASGIVNGRGESARTVYNEVMRSVVGYDFEVGRTFRAEPQRYAMHQRS